MKRMHGDIQQEKSMGYACTDLREVSQYGQHWMVTEPSMECHCQPNSFAFGLYVRCMNHVHENRRCRMGKDCSQGLQG